MRDVVWSDYLILIGFLIIFFLGLFMGRRSRFLIRILPPKR